MDDLSLKQFTAMNEAAEVGAYVRALEAFDGIPQLQELKKVAHARCGIGPGCSVLDVGCGFALETLRLAAMVAPGGSVAGIDKSADFIAKAKTRAGEQNMAVDFRVGEAESLPFSSGSFDCVRAERVLIYLEDPARAVAEMKRVAKPGGRIALIEPDFSTTTLNLADRNMVQRALAHESDTAVTNSWLPGPLADCLADLGFQDIHIDTRVLIFPQDLAATYFTGVGRHAAEAGALTPDDLQKWNEGIDTLRSSGRLFATVGYFLFTATV